MFTSTAASVGVVLLVWSAVPWQVGQDAFFFFIYFCGPSLVFSFAVVMLAVSKHHRWQAAWLFLISPFIYYTGGHILFRDDIYGAGSNFIASLLTAFAYLSASKLLIFRNGPWSIILKWVPLSLAAGIPFVYPVFKLGSDWLGNFWFWGFHILIWYTTVGLVLDKMANDALPPMPASERG